jgi:hypothetical protein
LAKEFDPNFAQKLHQSPTDSRLRHPRIRPAPISFAITPPITPTNAEGFTHSIHLDKSVYRKLDLPVITACSLFIEEHGHCASLPLRTAAEKHLFLSNASPPIRMTE